MTDILEGKHGVYDLGKREDCYAYLCRELGLRSMDLSILERIYKTAPPAIDNDEPYCVKPANV